MDLPRMAGSSIPAGIYGRLPIWGTLKALLSGPGSLLVTVYRLVGMGAATRAAKTVKSRAFAGMCKLKSAML